MQTSLDHIQFMLLVQLQLDFYVQQKQPLQRQLLLPQLQRRRRRQQQQQQRQQRQQQVIF